MGPAKAGHYVLRHREPYEPYEPMNPTTPRTHEPRYGVPHGGVPDKFNRS